MINNTKKASIVDIKRFAVHDGPGTRTTIFFKGCSLKCSWCHNPETIDIKKELSFNDVKCLNCRKCLEKCRYDVFSFADEKNHVNRVLCTFCGECIKSCPGEALKIFGDYYSVDRLYEMIIEDKDFYDISNGGVTLSGGEPLLQSKFAAKLLEKCKTSGIHTAVDTCGNVKFENFLDVIDYTDLFLYDIKHIDSAIHKKYTGSSNKLILENIIKLSNMNKAIEVRMLILPGINTQIEHIKDVGKFLKEISSIKSIKLLKYHDYASSKYAAIGKCDTMQNIEKPGNEYMESIRQILCEYGHDVIRA